MHSMNEGSSEIASTAFKEMLIIITSGPLKPLFQLSLHYKSGSSFSAQAGKFSFFHIKLMTLFWFNF